MGQRLTDRMVLALPAPDTGNKIYWDAPDRKGANATPGFGVRVTAAGSRAFILNYRTNAGRERRLTIGSPPAWTLAAAREAAAEHRHRIDGGGDPLADLTAGREAPTMCDLADRFIADELPKRRESTRVDYAAIIRRYISPALGRLKVAEVRHGDIEKLHRKIAETAPYRANRTVAILSRMFNLAIKWEMRADNPAKGIERKPEEKRERYLSPAEIARLAEALAARPGPSANAVRLLLLTGARRNEILSATWAQFDFEAGVWTKPASTTKQAKLHRIPLSAPALALLADMRTAAGSAPFLFPGAKGKPQSGLKKFWATICRDAHLASVRVHDLRHTFASVLASSGLSLPIIGKLLGHSQAATTQRYAHLLDDPLRTAAERAGAVITGSAEAKIVPLHRGARR
jgi:integrase